MQLVAARILNVIYGQDFLPSSFGYRPKVGAKEAVQEITSVLYWEKFGYISENRKKINIPGKKFDTMIGF